MNNKLKIKNLKNEIRILIASKKKAKILHARNLIQLEEKIEECEYKIEKLRNYKSDEELKKEREALFRMDMLDKEIEAFRKIYPCPNEEELSQKDPKEFARIIDEYYKRVSELIEVIRNKNI